MSADMLRVGEVARRGGLSVRTLHHYEELGLITPAQRTSSGHRLYGEDAVVRLQKIVALKQLGMSLEEIGGWLNGGRFRLIEALRDRRARVTAQIQALHDVDRRLEIIEKRMSDAAQVSVDDVLEALEAMAMFEKYYTQEQLDQLEQRRIQLGEDTIKAVEKEWPELIAKVQSAMERGVAPKSEEMRAIGKRWQELIEMFTGGDPGITASLSNMYRSEPSVSQRYGLNQDMFEYVSRSWTAE
jgi:MerR family transcriptional regulator, thiopeptide resistance regulator